MKNKAKVGKCKCHCHAPPLTGICSLEVCPVQECDDCQPKPLSELMKWLEEDHQNWEIERYVEALLGEERERVLAELENFKSYMPEKASVIDYILDKLKDNL